MLTRYFLLGQNIALLFIYSHTDPMENLQVGRYFLEFCAFYYVPPSKEIGDNNAGRPERYARLLRHARPRKHHAANNSFAQAHARTTQARSVSREDRPATLVRMHTGDRLRPLCIVHMGTACACTCFSLLLRALAPL
jgi:hypothetical protein